MNNLVFHELKKLFFKKILIFVVFFLLLTNAFNIYQSNDKFHDKYNLSVNEAEWSIYEMVEGKITAEKLGWITGYKAQLEEAANGGEDWDLTVVNNLLTELENTYKYSEKIDGLLLENDNQLAIYKQKGNGYLIKQSELVSQTYSARTIDSFYDVDTYNTYFNYDFSSFLILMIIFFATSSLYAGENESGMLSLMRSTPGGRLHLSNAKLAAMAIFTAAVCIAFFLCDFLMFLWWVRLRGFSNPLYSISSFEFTPLTVSIGGFSILLSVIKYVGFICFGLVSCIFSSVFKKSYMGFVTDFVLSIGFMAVSAYSGGVLDYFNLINPINLLTCRNIFSSFDVINIFGTPVFRYAVTFICAAVFICALYIGISLINNINPRAKGARKCN